MDTRYFLFYFCFLILRRIGENFTFHVFSCIPCVSLTPLKSQSGPSWRTLLVPVATTARAVLSLPAVPVTKPAARAAVVHRCVSTSTVLALGTWCGGDSRPKSHPSGKCGTCASPRPHLTKNNPAMRKQPSAGLGSVTAHAIRSGIGPGIPSILGGSCRACSLGASLGFSGLFLGSGQFSRVIFSCFLFFFPFIVLATLTLLPSSNSDPVSHCAPPHGACLRFSSREKISIFSLSHYSTCLHCLSRE